MNPSVTHSETKTLRQDPANNLDKEHLAHVEKWAGTLTEEKPDEQKRPCRK